MAELRKIKRTERLDPSTSGRLVMSEEEEIIIEADTAGEIIVILDAVMAQLTD